MHFVYLTLIALANNIDNISVRIAYSIRGIKISLWKNLWISIITFFISSISAFSGSILLNILSKQTCSIISLLLLVSIGLWIILEPYFKKENNSEPLTDRNENVNIIKILDEPERADIDKSNDIDFKEATLLGIALSINNIGGGLSAGVMGLNVIFIGLFSAVISFFAIWSGNYITGLFRKWSFEEKANILAGILLIALGIKQII